MYINAAGLPGAHKLLIFLFSTMGKRQNIFDLLLECTEADEYGQFPGSFQSFMLRVNITYVKRRKRSDTISYTSTKGGFEAHGFDKLVFLEPLNKCRNMSLVNSMPWVARI